MKKLLIASAALLFSVTACCNPFHHKDKPMMGKMMMKEMDANNDGVITKAEWSKSSDKRFSEIDADHNKKITEEELKLHQGKMKEKMEESKKNHKDHNQK